MSKRADRLTKAKSEEGSKLTCKKPDCNNDKHSYLEAPKQKHVRRRVLEEVGLGSSPAIETPHGPGQCWSCGDESVPWEVPHARDPKNIDLVVELLQRELIRFEYWRKPFDEDALAMARDHGPEATKRRLARRLRRPSYRKPANRYDMRQTPWTGEVIFYAQHATGTCCRHCVERWHGVPKDRPLTDEQVEYLILIATTYLDRRAADIWGNEA